MGKKYTKRDLEAFEKCGREWEIVLGLQDWEIDYRLPIKTDGDGFAANTIMTRNAMQATLILGEKDTPESAVPIKEYLDALSLHELLHLTLRPLTALGEARFCVDREDMEYEEHRVIQRFIKLLKGVK